MKYNRTNLPKDNSPDNPEGCLGRISLDINDHVIWNKDEFVKFLVEFQGSVIDIEIPEGACLQSLGVYDLLDLFSFESVTIRTHNLIESAPAKHKLNIHKEASFQYFRVTDIDYTPFHSWNGKKIFGALYNRPTWPRIGITGHLLTHHADKTLLNFRFDPSDPNRREFFEIQPLYNIDPNSVKQFMNISHMLPIQVEETDGYTIGATAQVHTDQLSKFYQDFLIDIVSETFVRGRSFYPTEKTTRAMLLKKPFIHMGSKCFLIYLRQMGFQTFNDFWPEDYDGYPADVKYLMILDLIDSIAKKPFKELVKMYVAMQPVLEHNYNLLKTHTFTKEITYVD